MSEAIHIDRVNAALDVAETLAVIMNGNSSFDAYKAHERAITRYVQVYGKDPL